MKPNRLVKTPLISTELPGPKTVELMNRKSSTFFESKDHNEQVLTVKRASGALIEDLDGNVFLSFNSSINSVGFNHPQVVRAVQQQMIKIAGSPRAFSVPFIECAEKLKTMLPGDLKSGKICYTTTGSEAIDLMTRIARQYSKKKILISFHGINFGEGTSDCSRLSGIGTHIFKGGLSPLITETLYAPWPYCYRCPIGHSLESCNLSCLNYFNEIFESYHPDQIAGVIFEGLPANSGVIIPPPGYLNGLRKICEENQLLLLVDEIFSGFGKTGKFLSVENWNILPDIVCLGKSMGAGFPISAVASCAEIIDDCGSIARGKVGSFSGTVISCTAAIETMNIIEKEKLLDRSRKIGNIIKKRFFELAEQYEIIGDIRVIGSLAGIELVKDRNTKTPDNKIANEMVKYAYRNGLLISNSGRYGNNNVIRLTPHLITSDKQVETALNIIEDSIKLLK